MSQQLPPRSNRNPPGYEYPLYGFCTQTVWTLFSVFSWNAYKTCNSPLNVWQVGLPSLILMIVMICFLYNTVRSPVMTLFPALSLVCCCFGCMAMICCIVALIVWPLLGLVWFIDSAYNTPHCTTFQSFLAIAIEVIFTNFLLGLMIHSIAKEVGSFINIRSRVNHTYTNLDGGYYRVDQELLQDNQYSNFLDFPLEENEKTIQKDKFTLKYRHNLVSANDDKTCVICYNEYKEGELVCNLPGCIHMFHWDCIKNWVDQKSNCPMCRKSIRAEIAKEIDGKPQGWKKYPDELV